MTRVAQKYSRWLHQVAPLPSRGSRDPGSGSGMFLLSCSACICQLGSLCKVSAYAGKLSQASEQPWVSRAMLGIRVEHTGFFFFLECLCQKRTLGWLADSFLGTSSQQRRQLQWQLFSLSLVLSKRRIQVAIFSGAWCCVAWYISSLSLSSYICKDLLLLYLQVITKYVSSLFCSF